jgi:hypothetical protein
MGEDGYLPERGLIPVDDDELRKIQEAVRNLERLEM